MKIIIILILSIIFLINFNYSQTILPNDQQDAINSILEEVFGESNYTNDICNFEQFKCVPINDGVSASDVYTITEFIFPSSTPTGIIIQTSFEPFKNLTNIQFINGIESPSFFNDISSFKYLKNVVISVQNSTIPSDLALPDSLENVIINYIGTPIYETFFSTGKISKLKIVSTGDKFALPSSIPTNNYLTQLSIPVGPNTPDFQFPSNLNNLQALSELYLSILNDREIDGITYTDFSFPNLPTSFSKLSTIIISFYNSPDSQDIQSWNFPQNLTKISTLSNLQINGKGFNLDTSIGLTDFSSLQENSVFTFQDSCEFIEQCTKLPCLKVPVGSGLTISECDFDLSLLDFTNVLDFSMTGNNKTQSLPSSNGIEFTKMNSFNVNGGNQLNGQLPNSYCQFGIDVLNVGNNLLSGEVPTCFSCAGYDSVATRYLLPNEFSNFNSNSVPTTCPSFSFDESYNKIVKTNGDTIITISGTDFGWLHNQEQSDDESVLIPTLTILVPNKQVQISFPKGEGKDKEFSASFGSDFKLNQVFKYSYQAPEIIDWAIDSTTKVFSLKGYGFSYLNINNVTINDKLYKASIATLLDNFDIITFTEDPTQNQDEISCTINVAGQVSKVAVFKLAEEPSSTSILSISFYLLAFLLILQQLL